MSSRWPSFHLTFVNEMYVSFSADTVGGIQTLLSREQKQSSFPMLWGVDVSYQTLPVNPALCFIPLTVLSPTSGS